jgi:hypothetical protein
MGSMGGGAASWTVEGAAAASGEGDWLLPLPLAPPDVLLWPPVVLLRLSAELTRVLRRADWDSPTSAASRNTGPGQQGGRGSQVMAGVRKAIVETASGFVLSLLAQPKQKWS